MRELGPICWCGVLLSVSPLLVSQTLAGTTCCLGSESQSFTEGPIPIRFSLTATSNFCSLPVQSGGELVMELTEGCGAAATAVSQDFLVNKTVAKLCGDFDVLVDYRAVTYPVPTAGFRSSALEILTLSDSHVASIELLAQPDDGCHVGGQFYKAWTTNPSNCVAPLFETGDTAGGFRVARVGSVARMYYGAGSGGGWVELYSDSVTTENVYFAIFTGWRDVPSGQQAQDFRYDNLQIVAEAQLCVPATCRAGDVNSGRGPITDVLLVNGSPGDANGVVTVPTRMSFQLALNASPSGPGGPGNALGRYVLWVWLGFPSNAFQLTARGEVLGCTANPTPLHRPTAPQPHRCLRGAGVPQVGCAGLPNVRSPARAPWILTRSHGFPFPIVISLQGLLEDAGAANPVGFSVTNAVTLRIE